MINSANPNRDVQRIGMPLILLSKTAKPGNLGDPVPDRYCHNNRQAACQR